MNADAGRALYYILIEAEKDASRAPLLLWLNGCACAALLRYLSWRPPCHGDPADGSLDPANALLRNSSEDKRSVCSYSHAVNAAEYSIAQAWFQVSV